MPTLLDLYLGIMISQLKNATFPSEAVRELGDGNPRTGEYLQKCRMRIFNLMVINPSNLSFLHGLFVLVIKLKKVAALHFLRYPPARALTLRFFNAFSGIRYGWDQQIIVKRPSVTVHRLL